MSVPSDFTNTDIRIQHILTELSKVELELIENKTFIDQDVHLDGREFSNCIFKNCAIHVKLGHFRISGKVHLENCNFILYPPAQGVKSIFDAAVSQQKT